MICNDSDRNINESVNKKVGFRQNGMTLLEVIIVLGIMGVIAAGVVVLAQRAMDNQNVSKLSQSLNVIQTAMVQTYRSQKSYPALTSDADSEKLISALTSMGKITASDSVNPFTGQALKVLTLADNKAANRGFVIKVENLSQNQCKAMVSNSADLFSFIQIETAGGALVTDMYTDPNAATPTGVIKSTKGGPGQYNVTNLDHVTALCGSDAGSSAYYDVFFGNR
ncbi:type IV pilus major pilin [Vibrio cholerae]|uniref:type IV pilus major pilin n=1 Tax=Vibrio cholerae TaxID=666 RepID=UPI000BA91ADB|nr:type IV pilus major pilin [Vibrio cholerae]PAR92352.1 toxin coregulated pilin subunit precursor TcpA [Vibrio cholerae]